MKKFIFILFFVPMIGFAQERISVNDVRSLFSNDWKNNCITVDTIKADPFTGVIYLSYYVDRCEPLKAIIHYEEGLKDGTDIDLAGNGKIISIANYSKGELSGIQFFNEYADYANNSYRTKFKMFNFFNRYRSYWTKDELINGGFINKDEKNIPHILKYDMRKGTNGEYIYDKYYNGEGKEISKSEYEKLKYKKE